MSTHQEKQVTNLRCWVVTISDTRTEETDVSGRFIREILTQNDHTILKYKILEDEPSQIERLLQEFHRNQEVQILILNGGTGISPRDVTYQTIITFLEGEIKGFGELFRHLSYKEIGARAQLSMACAGYVNQKLIFSLPGSKKAVRLGMEKLILPVLGHAMYELTKD
jgi:molybdenum cofactor biosynthesis protein B